VLTEKAALVDPAATVSVDGTTATKLLLLDRLTTTPPLGAGPLSVTVPVAEFPPVTLVGLSVSEESVADLTTSDAVRVTPLYEAEMLAEVDVPTGLVLTVNVALVAPAATVTLDGTIAALGLLLDRLITASPLGAGPLSVTVPEADVPPVTLVGLNVSEESETAGSDEDCSNSNTAGFRSLKDNVANFDGETTYTTAPAPDPGLSVIVPLPFAGDEETLYVALNATPGFGPLAAPMSSVPLRLPVGAAPSPVNSPERTTTPKVAGVVVTPV
jgi:hypothetical protein